jgi:molecular chaperone DnaK (HSP70)
MTKLEMRISADILRITAIEFWFTVPAIWSDSAKQDTLAAARAAGFGTRPGDEVNLILEPEAAAIATLKGLTSDGAEDQISVSYFREFLKRRMY